MENGSSPLIGNLRDELVAATSRQNQKRARLAHAFRNARRAALAALSVAILAAAGLFLTASPSQAHVLHVEKSNDVLTIDLINPSATPKQIMNELKHVHVKAVVTNVPVPAPLVGQFVQTGLTQSGVQPISVSEGSYRSFRLPAKSGAIVQLQLGRQANPGETFARDYDAFAAGGPLACKGVLGKRVSDVAPIVNAALPDVQWRSIAPGSSQTGSADSVKDQYVTGATWVGSDRVFVTTAPDASAAAPEMQSVAHVCTP